MMSASERRASRRFNMSLPMTLRLPGEAVPIQTRAETRDVSFRGLYFTMNTRLEAGAALEFVLTLPKEVTMAGDVHIRCFGEVIRVDRQDERCGVAAKIDRYEFLPPPVNSPIL
ncbi:MAG: PilZ domain-containing protein [Acidobacteria bacterium]|nr:PilZ domain-containing protein [Acidobacteriota bacterium]